MDSTNFEATNASGILYHENCLDECIMCGNRLQKYGIRYAKFCVLHNKNAERSKKEKDMPSLQNKMQKTYDKYLVKIVQP